MGNSENELPLQLVIYLKRYYPDLVRSSQNRLYTFAYRLTRSPQDAEDIVQEAFTLGLTSHCGGIHCSVFRH